MDGALDLLEGRSIQFLELGVLPRLDVERVGHQLIEMGVPVGRRRDRRHGRQRRRGCGRGSSEVARRRRCVRRSISSRVAFVGNHLRRRRGRPLTFGNRDESLFLVGGRGGSGAGFLLLRLLRRSGSRGDAGGFGIDGIRIGLSFEELQVNFRIALQEVRIQLYVEIPSRVVASGCSP